MLTSRQCEALRHDISLCVTAGAGTGKTHVLVNRYIKLIEDAGCRPSEILALTFTDKAASEMKERVEKEIFKKNGPFWEQIKEEMMWANISTFHSFCSKVLREFPIEAGIDPGYCVLSENESEEIISGAINSLFKGIPEKRIKESLDDCLCAFGTYYLDSYLRELYRQRRYSKEFFEQLAHDEESILNKWHCALLVEKESISSEFKNSSVLTGAADTLLLLAESFAGDDDKGAAYLKSAKEHLILLKSRSPEDICRGLYGIASLQGGSKAMGSRKLFGDKKELLAESYSALKEYASGLPSDILIMRGDKNDPSAKRTIKLLKSLGQIFTALEDKISREKHIRGAIDFSDMINLTYGLFKTYPELVRKSYADRFRFIMIDEFQDTDPVQAEIVTGIVEAKRELSGNQECNSLFVVGDPKQSIYLFRDADVAQFKHSGRKISEEYKGGLVALDINFRSTNEVLSFVNILFSRILKESEKPWDFSYEPVCVSENRAADRGSVELLFTPDAKTAAERAVFEAEAVARKLRMIVDQKDIYVFEISGSSGETLKKNASWGDIAILLERRNNLRFIEYALKKYDIPFRVYGGLGLYEKQEILDAKSVLSFLKNQGDDISLYAALRSPWFGFSDAELFRIAGGHSHGLFEKLKKSELAKAKSAYSLLSSWLLCARKKAPSEIFRKIIRESGIAAVYTGIYGGEQAMANLEKLSDIIREREKGGYYSLDKLVAELSASVLSNDREGEAEPEDTGEDAVLIMTVHASKGLEFPVVIVPGLSDAPPAENSAIIVDGELGAGIKIPDFETGDDYANSPPLSIQRYRMKQKTHAESKRLFYVAATRARDHLILTASAPKEIPNSGEVCKTRAEWVLFFLLSGHNEDLSEGIHIIGVGESTGTIKISRSEHLPEYRANESKGKLITLPDGFKEPDSRFKFEINLESDEEKTHSHSATEILAFLAGEKSHVLKEKKRFLENPLLRKNVKKSERGEIIHAIFAGEDAYSVFSKFALENAEKADDYIKLYRIFLETPLMKSSKRSFCELSFITNIGGHRFSGSIDRLVETQKGWYIIDYKTGESMENHNYELQIAVYKKAAADILGIMPGAFIYHTDTGEFTEINPDMDAAELIIIKACEGIEGENN